MESRARGRGASTLGTKNTLIRMKIAMGMRTRRTPGEAQSGAKDDGLVDLAARSVDVAPTPAEQRGRSGRTGSASC